MSPRNYRRQLLKDANFCYDRKIFQKVGLSFNEIIQGSGKYKHNKIVKLRISELRNIIS